jgi:hypothetical protein
MTATRRRRENGWSDHTSPELEWQAPLRGEGLQLAALHPAIKHVLRPRATERNGKC